MSHDWTARVQHSDCIAESRGQTECPIEDLVIEQIGVVENSCAAANDRLAFSPRVPRKTSLRSEVFRRTIYRAGECRTELSEFRCAYQIVVCNVAVEVV